MWINVGVSKYDGKNHIYDITKNERVANRSSTDLSRPVGNAMKSNSSTTIIPDSKKKINSEGENNENGEADNEKRTEAWLKQLGLQLPSRLTKYGSINIIPYSEKKVNGEEHNNENTEADNENAPKLYEELRRFIKTEIYSKESYEQLVKRRYEQYEKRGEPVDYEYAEEEVMANALENMLGKERVMQKLAGEHKSLFSRIWRSIKNFFEKLFKRARETDRFSRKTVESDLLTTAAEGKQKKLEDMFVKALRTASENADALRRAGVEGSDVVKNSISTEERTPITAEMTEEERYEALKDRVINNVPVSTEIPSSYFEKYGDLSSWEDVNKYLGGKKRKIIKKLASEFGVIDKEYLNIDIDLSFGFSGNSFEESYSKQKRNYVRFAKMFSVFDAVVEKAVGIEIHNNVRHKPDITLDNVYVLMSAYQDGDFVIPVKLEVKKFKDKKNILYVAISLEKIKKTEVSESGDTENGVTQNSRSVNISISQLFSKINPIDKSFLKYVPDGFLNGEQKTAKREAIKEAADKDYKAAIERGDMKIVQKMVDEAAKNAGYTIRSYHGTLAKDFTEFKKSFIGSRFNYDDKGFFFIDRKNIAEDYAKSEFDSKKKGRVLDVYLRVKKPLLVDKRFCLCEGLGNPFRDKDVIDVWDAYSEFFKEEAETGRCDGIIVDDGTSKMTVVFNSEQIKSADPITYDDNGNVIPLSERFNSRRTDIRYSISDEYLSREVLAEAAENIAETDAEREVVRQYREKLFEIDDMLDKRRRLEARLRELEGMKGMATERQRITNNIKTLTDSISRRDEKLLLRLKSFYKREALRCVAISVLEIAELFVTVFYIGVDREYSVSVIGFGCAPVLDFFKYGESLRIMSVFHKGSCRDML